jgi:DNA-binding CsgD family transcriptional regulator
MASGWHAVLGRSRQPPEPRATEPHLPDRRAPRSTADGSHIRRRTTPGQRAVAASTGPGSLTGREREITALAVQDMSARAIGELLHIGERTVESHLARVYLKFGVHSRQQLAHAIAGLSP